MSAEEHDAFVRDEYFYDSGDESAEEENGEIDEEAEGIDTEE